MRVRTQGIPALVLACLLPTLSFAHGDKDDNPVHIIAEILLNLNHSPAPEDRARLDEIFRNQSYSKPVRLLAKSLYGLKHQLGDDDEVLLDQLSNDARVPDPERQLARILIELRHQVSMDDRRRLINM